MSLNFQNNTKPNDLKYPKLIDEVNEHWQKQLADITKIKEDIKIIERMFNDYNNNEIFIECKEALQQSLHTKQLIINKMEEQFYLFKRNFNIN
jgi:hypothetical protein